MRWLLLLLVIAGCPSDDDMTIDAGADDAAVDAPEPEVCDPLPGPFQVGDAAGHADPLGSAAGEARAGALTAEMLPDDPSGLATWAPGDFVVANDRVAVVIESMRVSDGYDPWGGKPNGLARIEGGAMVEPAAFNELLIGVGRFTFEPTSVGVFDDGTDDAVVRAVGALHPIPFVDDLARVFAPLEYGDLTIAVDYRLAPDAEVVDVTYTLSNPRARGTSAPNLFLIFQTKRMPAFGPVRGFQVDSSESYPWMGFADDDATSYAIEPTEEVGLILEISGAIVLQGERASIGACGETALPYYRLHVGAGRGMNGVREAIWRSEGVATTSMTGRVLSADGAPMAGVRVHAETDDAYITRTLTDESGNYQLSVPADVTPQLRAFRPGEGFSDPVASGDITMPAVGFVSIRAIDSDDQPLPVRVQTAPVGRAEPSIEAKYGEPDRPGRRTHVVFPLDGEVTLPLLPGMHQVVVSRGYEYDIFDSDITVVAGPPPATPTTVVLDRVVDTTGVMCADYHIHTDRSPDSEDPGLWKLGTAAADGLEIPCRSDHEWVYEWDVLGQENGLGDYVFGVTSMELTTFAWGHFGVVPVEPRPEMQNRGSIPWIDRMPADVFNDVRALPEDPVLIINHPRGAAIGGYFSAANYDPVTGEVGNPELWDEDFQAVEVFNDDSFEESMEIVNDWFSFLNQGRRVWAVGSSDTHGVMRGSPIGYPRTCLDVGVDDAASLRAGGGAALVRDVTRAGAFTVSGGLYLTVEGRDGVRPGGEIASAMARESFHVVVQAAPWVDADELEVWVDGELAETLPIPDSTDVIRLETDVEVEGGAWVVFHAKGGDTLEPVHPGRSPFAVSQPIFMMR